MTECTQIPQIINHARVCAMTPTGRYQKGQDFAAWQKNTKKRLEQLVGMDTFQKCEDDLFCVEWSEKKEGYTEYRITLQTELGYRSAAHMLVPDSRKEGEKLPMVICLQGHSTGMHISLGTPKYPGDAEDIAGGRDFALQAMREGYIAVACEQRNFGECGGDENGPKCYESSMTAILSGRTTIAERVWDISRTIDALLREFGEMIDETKIVCTGNSGGGTATFYAACLDERIAVAMPCCSVCTYKDSIAAMFHCACNFIPGIAKEYDMGDLAGLIAPRPLITLCGKNDTAFPVEGVKETMAIAKESYRAAGAEQDCNYYIGNGGHQYYPEFAWPHLKEYMNRP